MLHLLKKSSATKVGTIVSAPNSTNANGNEKRKDLPIQKFPSVHSLRKWIIQKLAVRPYEKSEIEQHFCIKDDDGKRTLNIIWNEVTYMRDGITSLKSDLWKEVEANWFFYSPEDAAIVQKSILLWMMRSLPVLCLFKRSRRKLTLKKKNKQPPRPFCVDLGRKVKRGICLLEEYTKQWGDCHAKLKHLKSHILDFDLEQLLGWQLSNCGFHP
ncbi:uncharacterized protein LOC129960859 [Argiope bruennichi]|uniref:uncharacterized protein LOC129960859 n=1 Tax=Argiope bruennichi TaxID=94029 RepID=UPI002493E043|nr:uncharacterized protein LOC129960859 [Argiope bruennichi]XP_055930537.1 uncharacterized protein LOC129960859 [Argiope bruennichi]XP_055930538.1 uncharacterized protein LOC129960859 [Argiope bruennichi]XP_055930539.1 uncharacterized protein LOC129960859 [Argiope bruennichi]